MDHEHSLKRKPPGEPYTCSGCKELGFGSSYHCENKNCSYVLHGECAYPDPHARHPFFRKSCFDFLRKPPGYKRRYCNACGGDVLGFVYHCSKTGYDLHPCCLKLQDSISDGDVKLQLYRKSRSKCVKCKHKHVVGNIQGWSYYDGNSSYHVSCFKALILDNWRRGCFSQGHRSTTNLATTSGGATTQLTIVGRRSGRIRSMVAKMAVVAFKLIFSAIFGNPISFFTTILEVIASN
ncbi:hypothetical protein MtrunA17_Chr7g0223501 [Medicago truncatula]|uniref:Cysteine/histidine-rich C1 domain protein n=1 Tax=Medicago truncatula TaxID=3880 RepID=A2Q6B0_MEDTR|nr:uncharacterized protein LOC11446105 [Medicago truncatula]ABN09130.1 DC1; C1-like [Medicago truncatula]AES78147.1 cysteine/histidine-rich C1 domain protein [Medicago truncatula]RHN44814.1 hypothetical protein MtrunA17_Chr7g0223501 [Medicago truncatula]